MNPLRKLLDYCEKKDQLCTRIWSALLAMVIFVSLSTFLHIAIDQYQIKDSIAKTNAEKIKLLEEQVQLLKQIVKKEHGYNL